MTTRVARSARVVRLAVIGLCCAISGAKGQCAESILDPGLAVRTSSGAPTAYADYLSLVDALYANEAPAGATKTIIIGGLAYQAPPWFKSSTDCAEAILWDREGPASSFADYLLDGDAFSELMIVTSLAIPFLSVYWRLRGAIHFRVGYL